jgi:hypothetical protein
VYSPYSTLIHQTMFRRYTRQGQGTFEEHIINLIIWYLSDPVIAHYDIIQGTIEQVMATSPRHASDVVDDPANAGSSATVNQLGYKLYGRSMWHGKLKLAVQPIIRATLP